jgi:predicted NBD/HSP70 family sugar kinase
LFDDTIKRYNQTVTHSFTDNERNILENVFWEGTPSRHTLIEQTGFSKSKLNALVSNLLAEGWLEEGETHRTSSGRPASDVHLSTRFGYVIGIDLWANIVHITLSDANLRFVATTSEMVDVRGGPQTVMPVITKSIKNLLKQNKLEPSLIGSVGMGVPGPVDFAGGTMVHPILMAGWEGLSFSEYFASSLGLSVVVDNDVNVMALGELWHHRTNANISSRNENIVVVKLSAGIGAAIIAQGNIYRGSDGAAGDIAHICVDPNGQRCVCGNVGCLEMLSGAQAIVRAATEAATSQPNTYLANILLQQQTITVQDVGAGALGGDNSANEIIHRAGSAIGQVLAATVNLLNPSRILLGGEVAQISPLLLASIRQSVYSKSLSLSTRQLRIDYTRLGERSGLYGAAALAVLTSIRAPSSRKDLT